MLRSLQNDRRSHGKKPRHNDQTHIVSFVGVAPVENDSSLIGPA
jgi:hypothetical protein